MRSRQNPTQTNFDSGLNIVGLGGVAIILTDTKHQAPLKSRRSLEGGRSYRFVLVGISMYVINFGPIPYIVCLWCEAGIPTGLTSSGNIAQYE